MSESNKAAQLLETSFKEPYYDMPAARVIKPKQSANNNRKCSRCKKTGHYKVNCPLERALVPPLSKSEVPTGDMAPAIAYFSEIASRGNAIDAEIKGHIAALKKLKTERDTIRKYKEDMKDNFPLLKFMYPEQ